MRNLQVTIKTAEYGFVYAVNQESGDTVATNNQESHLPQIPASLVKAFKDSGKESFNTYLRLDI